MTHGFIALNDNNQVLVSSDTRNLHFLGKYTTPIKDSNTTAYGGTHKFHYNVTSPVPPVPFFTIPVRYLLGNYGTFLTAADTIGIVGIRNTGGNTWRIDMLKNGADDNYPEVYVFVDPRGLNPTDTHGMIVYRDDGTAAFDSRNIPLAVTGGLAVSHPSNPRDTFSGSLSADNCSSSEATCGDYFKPNQSNSYFVSMPTKPMFHYSSLAQAEREAHFHRSEQDCNGVEYGVCIGFDTEENWNSWYWCFYRGGLSRSDNYIYAGWIAAAAGCHWTYSQDDSFLGFVDLGGGGGADGVWPYSNETLNLAATSVIIGDASRYD